EYIKSNFSVESIRALKADFVLILGLEGEVLCALHAMPDSGEFSSVPQEIIDTLLPSTTAGKHLTRDKPVRGLVTLPGGWANIGSSPILKNEGRGSVKGWILFGHMLQPELIHELSSDLNVDIQVHPLE